LTAAHQEQSRAASKAAVHNLPRDGLLLLAILTVTWGANWPAMKLAVMEVEPWTFRSLCLLVGAAGQFAIALGLGQRLRFPREDLKPVLVLAFFNISVWHIVTAFGLTMLEAGRASLIAYTMPLWATILSVSFLGEKLSRRQFLGLAAGLAGLGVLLLPAVDGIARSAAGSLLMLAAAVTWAIGTVGMKRVRWHMPIIQMTAWQLLLGCVPLLAGMAIAGKPQTLLEVSSTGAVALLYACAVGMVFCHYAWFKIVQLFPANVAAISLLGVPIVGLLSSAWILGEPIGAADLLALILIVSALALVLIVPGLPRRQAA
jgi:drug/metabolite transporter (DMT)-like permease